MAKLVSDPTVLASLEAENGIRQYRRTIDVIQTFLEPERPFALRPSLIRELQKVACDGLDSDAGEWRSRPVSIGQSSHQPPGPHLVRALVDELCDYVNDNWHEKPPLHLAAYVMWRLNWIHPFSDGNGRTSRAVSYVVLNVKLGYLLPGTPSIPDQIQQGRKPYFEALEAADRAYAKDHRIDVSQMEEMLKGMLATQLLSVIASAQGGNAVAD